MGRKAKTSLASIHKKIEKDRAKDRAQAVANMAVEAGLLSGRLASAARQTRPGLAGLMSTYARKGSQ